MGHAKIGSIVSFWKLKEGKEFFKSLFPSTFWGVRIISDTVETIIWKCYTCHTSMYNDLQRTVWNVLLFVKGSLLQNFKNMSFKEHAYRLSLLYTQNPYFLWPSKLYFGFVQWGMRRLFLKILPYYRGSQNQFATMV